MSEDDLIRTGKRFARIRVNGRLKSIAVITHDDTRISGYVVNREGERVSRYNAKENTETLSVMISNPDAFVCDLFVSKHTGWLTADTPASEPDTSFTP